MNRAKKDRAIIDVRSQVQPTNKNMPGRRMQVDEICDYAECILPHDKVYKTMRIVLSHNDLEDVDITHVVKFVEKCANHVDGILVVDISNNPWFGYKSTPFGNIHNSFDDGLQELLKLTNYGTGYGIGGYVVVTGSIFASSARRDYYNSLDVYEWSASHSGLIWLDEDMVDCNLWHDMVNMDDELYKDSIIRQIKDNHKKYYQYCETVTIRNTLTDYLDNRIH